MVTIPQRRFGKLDAATLHHLDALLASDRPEGAHALPGQPLALAIGHVTTGRSNVPFLALERCNMPPLLDVSAELSAFAAAAGQMAPTAEQTAMLEDFQFWVPLPVVVTERAWVKAILKGDACVLSLEVEGLPGGLYPFAIPGMNFWPLQAGAAQSRGIVVGFAEHRRLLPPLFLVCQTSFITVDGSETPSVPIQKPLLIPWPDPAFASAPKAPLTPAKPKKPDLVRELLFTPGLADEAKSMAKRSPRDLLILHLAVDMRMTPAEVGQLNLDQVRLKNGRVYLKGSLVRRKAVYSLLAGYRKRDRDLALSGEPLFRDPKRPEKRLGAVGIRRIIEDYVVKAKRRLNKQAGASE